MGRRVRPAAPKARNGDPKRAGAKKKPSGSEGPLEEDPPLWTEVKELAQADLQVGSAVLARVWYSGEEGLVHGNVREDTTDDEGRWVGLEVKGTQVHQLRSYLTTNPRPDSILYLSRSDVPLAKRHSAPGVGYLLSYRTVELGDHLPWMDNCKDRHPGDIDENADLREAARRVGSGPPYARGVQSPPPIVPDGEEGQVVHSKPSGGKKLSGKQKVKKMIEKARWDCKGTPLDPVYKKPVKLKVKRRASSSSSRSSHVSRASISSEEGLGAEHRLKAISKKLPGYLCRSSAKEAKRNLAESCGEAPCSLKVFHRYYRQVVAPRGGSRGMQREMLTLSVILDTLIEGNVLQAMDTAAQRLKSLELMQQGSEANLALQIELLPRDHFGMVADSEARYAQKQFTAESKLQQHLKGNPGTGKGSWSSAPQEFLSLDTKGKRNSSEKGKGKEHFSKGSIDISKPTVFQT